MTKFSKSLRLNLQNAASGLGDSIWRLQNRFTIVVGEEVGHLVDADAVEFCVRDFPVEPLPDRDGDVFRRGDGAFEFGDFEVEVAMIVDADDLALEDVFELFEVDDEAGGGIDFACDGDFEGVVVAVAVAVGALAEDALVLFG